MSAAECLDHTIYCFLSGNEILDRTQSTSNNNPEHFIAFQVTWSLSLITGSQWEIMGTHVRLFSIWWHDFWFADLRHRPSPSSFRLPRTEEFLKTIVNNFCWLLRNIFNKNVRIVARFISLSRNLPYLYSALRGKN